MKLSGWTAGLGISLWAVAAVGQTPSATPTAPEHDRLEARTILKQLVEINTTHAQGSTAAAEALKARLLDAGFSPVDLIVIAPPEHPAKGSLVVRFRGKGRAKPILFIGHLDVVEAKREDWSVDPFKLTQKDGYYYGRGSEDMKSGDAALVESLIRLKRQGFAPDRDIICAFTADEEAGGDSNGPALLLKNHRDLIDAGSVFNFDGGGGGMKAGRRLYFEIGTSEKIYLTFTLETTSPGGHGSLPGPDNAIYRLADGLGRLETFQFPVTTTPTTRISFAAFSRLDPGPQSQDMLAMSKDPPDPAAAERLSRTVRLNAQLRTTCVATLVSGGHAENALPQRARATIQCRLMPGDTVDHVQKALVATLNDPQISVSVDAPPVISPESPLTPEILGKVEETVHDMWPGVAVVPTMSTGFSDGRQTRNAGMPTYNVGGLWVDIDDNRAHGRDERIGVQAFDESVEYAYRLMKRLSRAD